MPVKKGPHNSFRHYNSSNGRYIKETPEQKLQRIIESSQMKKSKKIDKNYNSLYNRVIKLQDPGLQESLMKFIKLNPHFIKEVDRYFKDENGISYQIDLISKRLFIEYKYGEASGHTKQFYNQIRLAKLYNKTAVILAPNMKEEKFLKFKNKGFLIFRTEEDIINYERNGKNDCSITINK